MSGNAHRGDHDVAFYEAAIEETWALSASTSLAQFDDDHGPLKPGRYVIQVRARSEDEMVVWVIVGAFVKGAALTATAGPGLKRFPISEDIGAIETHVLKGESDRIAVITDVGTATVYVSRVSSAINKG